ncbi:MAG: tripartite tricarboxylate transporter substrate binding protein [Betaproteobacteria bacterium PRO3]|nr:tripartite tricarboxylate transporter substrate binding protein [Betaproteobacteria bacterium PRO3]
MRAIIPLLATIVLAPAPAPVSAQEYPSRPIRVLVGSTAGSGIDVGVRILADKLRDALGQPIVIEVKPSADGVIAVSQVASSAPDGYTLVAATNGQMAIAPLLLDPPPYDPIRDFEPVAMLARFALVFVASPTVPASTFAEFVAYAKANPGKLNYGSASTNFQFGTERLKSLAGIDLYPVPYIGVPAVVKALLAGEVQFALLSVLAAAPHVKAGTMQALAVTSATREAVLPDVPTLREVGVHGYDLDIWVALIAPKGTPPEIVARLGAAVDRSLDHPEVRDKFAAVGMVPLRGSPRVVRETVQRDAKTYAALASSVRPPAK